jgi:CDP-diacylglycerol--glycerol-3-phosphate 3-phosphatidyltransferase
MAQSKNPLPTLLTLARMAAGPIVALLVLWAAHLAYIDPPRAGVIYGWATGVFALAGLSDWLDGWLARKLGATSVLGAALDHAADKVLAACVLTALAYAALPVDLVIAAVLLLGRDAAVAGLREGLSSAGRAPGVGMLGKWKTAAALTGVALLLAQQSAALAGGAPGLIQALSWGGSALLWAAAALALISGAIYAAAALRPAATIADQPKDESGEQP